MQLVFASGFLIPQRLFGIDYYRGLPQLFAAGPHRAIFPDVPVTGTLESRARVLAAAIRAAYPTGPIHIIAHSMAGLDCRVMIGADMEGLSAPGRIASLTTLGTPHRGTPLADLLLGSNPNGHRRQFHDAVIQTIGTLGIDAGALAGLTSDAADTIPDVARTHPHIAFSSYAGIGRPGPLATNVTLTPTHLYILQETGQPNDGLVHEESARYGEYHESWPCDHSDMVGHNFDTASLGFFRFDHFAAIQGIIESLEEG